MGEEEDGREEEGRGDEQRYRTVERSIVGEKSVWRPNHHRTLENATQVTICINCRRQLQEPLGERCFPVSDFRSC